jgi:hypothetical protein
MDEWIAVGVALIGALAGLGGAILGSRIAGRATLQAAIEAREEARLARFADRIRELGGIVLDSAHRFRDAVEERQPTAHLGVDCPRQIRELRLVVRHNTTGLVLDEMLTTLSVIDLYRPGGKRENPEQLRRLLIECRQQLRALEDAIRDELGLRPAPHAEPDFG